MKKANGLNSRSRGLGYAKNVWFNSTAEKIGIFTTLFAISLFVYVICMLFGIDIH